MNSNTLTDLFHFHYWARDQLLAGLAQLDAVQYATPLPGGWGSIRDTVAHLVDAEQIWLARITGRPLPTWDENQAMATLEAARQHWAASETSLWDYLRHATDMELSRVVDYANSKGQPFHSPVWQILLHLVNHGTEHRAQLSTLLTQLGISHPGMDMIFYWRR